MTMLTHAGGLSRPASHFAGGRDAPGTASSSTQMALLKRFLRGALTTLMLGGAFGGIVVLKTAAYFSRMNY